MKNKAFTLAEVLITLAIIGVIAAITIPSIIANHQKRTLETQFAKAYRTLSQAVSLAAVEHGDLSTWGWKNSPMTTEEQEAFVKKYFIPYLNIIKHCPADKSTGGCFPNVAYKYLNGESATNYSTRDGQQITLADGSSVHFQFSSVSYIDGKTLSASVYVDTNGHKNPNQFGRDFFQFSFYPQTGEFLPHGINKAGAYDEGKMEFEKFSKKDIDTNCSLPSSQGWNCTARIVMDGFKMNY